MPTKITMPAFSSTMESGKLIQWLASEGDKVVSGQPIAEVETDKAVAEIEATIDGYLAKILISEPDTDISVNATMGFLLKEGESTDTLKECSEETPETGIEDQITANKIKENTSKNSSQLQLKTSPGARRAADEAGVDLKLVPGSGPKGRITRADVISYIAEKSASSGLQTSAEANVDNVDENNIFIDVSPMRSAIANRLLESKRDIPHYYLDIRITLDKLLDLKANLAQTGELPGLSLNIFFIKAAALAMKKIPKINTTWMKDKIVQRYNCNIGVAVAVDDGLIVPVIADVDKKDLSHIDREANELIGLAKSNRLPLSKLGNASLTVSNLGMYNIDKFYAIINPPEACILALGKIQKTPVVVDDNIAIRKVMTCSMSADHRLIDGAVAAQFLNKFKTLLEDPRSILA